MEESEKINGKKRLPSIPSNYVTILQLKERWIKEQERKQQENEGNGEPQREQEEKEKQVEEREADGVAKGGSCKNGHFRRYDRENGKPKEEEIAAVFAVSGSEDVEKEKKGEELKKKKKKWRNKRKNKKEEKAGAENEGGKVVRPAVDAPPPASVENNKREEEVIGDQVHAPKQASVKARRKFNPSTTNRTEDPTVEIGRRFRAMSVKDETRTEDSRRYGRQSGYFNHHGGNRALNRGHYGESARRREPNQRSEGMVWVKKGAVSDGNVGDIQSSSSHPSH